MARLAEDRFRIFVSHKHEDHALAVAVQQALEGLSPKIECFVSGVSIAAGADWNREIKSSLAQSHMLILLFTRPTASWDWCLFETGLFARSDVDDVSAVVCLFDPQGTSPSPLANLQGVPVQRDAIERFLGDLCRATWRVSDDWRLGALVPRVRDNQLARAAAKIVDAFPERAAADVSHYPCHRIVLDLRHLDTVDGGIPDDAKVIVGPGATTDFTLALFNVAEAATDVTWGQLVDAVDGRSAVWRSQLDRRFVAALNKALFTPITGTFRAWSQGRRQQRVLKPVLYRIVWTADGIPGAGRVESRGRPAEVTLLLDSLPVPTRVGGSELHLVRINARFQTEVFDEFTGTVHAKAREGIAVLDDIREALELVYDEANSFGVFDPAELRRVYGEDYARLGLDEMGQRWMTMLADLQTAIDERDLDAVEDRLVQLRRLNRTFSRLSTERLMHTFDADG